MVGYPSAPQVRYWVLICTVASLRQLLQGQTQTIEAHGTTDPSPADCPTAAASATMLCY